MLLAYLLGVARSAGSVDQRDLDTNAMADGGSGARLAGLGGVGSYSVMPSAESAESIAWLDWGADAFARSAAEQKPILLFIGAAWCRWTAEMDRFSFRDPRVVRLVADRFLPVRVDAERRPDVSARYTLDGWPTTAFLTPDGDLLGGGTYLDADALTRVLADVAEAFAERRADIAVRAAAARTAASPGGEVAPHGTTARGGRAASAGRQGPGGKAERFGAADREERSAGNAWAAPAGGPGPGGRADRTSVVAPSDGRTADDPGLDDDAGQWLRELLLGRFDETSAGFGEGPRRVEADALAAALGLCRETRDADLSRIVTRTLDAMAAGGLWDPVDGGFFRYCAGRDWSDPAPEKLLAPNARLLGLYLSASTLFEREDYADRARALVRFVHGTLADPEGGFFASQRGAPDPDRPGRSPAPGAGAVDRTVYTDATAVMASGYVHGASVLDDDSLLQFAAESVDRVVMATYERGAGVGHAATGDASPRGLLADQVLASAALLDLYEATGQPVYLDLPRELMAYCRHALWDETGGFADRDPTLRGPDAPVGLVRDPVYPLDLNCRAAMVLARLAELAEEPGYLDLARRTLMRQTPSYRGLGLDGAAYVLALDAVSGESSRR